MHIIEDSSREVLGAKFWEYFTESLHSQKQSQIIIGLSGGSSLDSFYEILRMRFGEIDESIRIRIYFAFLDERIVPERHEDRNEKQLRERFLTSLLEHGLIQESQILSVRHDLSDIASEYSTRVPRIDIGLFGVGPDGHIASLFPQHPLLDSLSKDYLEITDSPKLPAHRITVSPEMIREISYAIVAFMRGKEEVYTHFMDDSILLKACPVKMLLLCKNLVVMSDIDIYN